MLNRMTIVPSALYFADVRFALVVVHVLVDPGVMLVAFTSVVPSVAITVNAPVLFDVLLVQPSTLMALDAAHAAQSDGTDIVITISYVWLVPWLVVHL